MSKKLRKLMMTLLVVMLSVVSVPERIYADDQNVVETNVTETEEPVSEEKEEIVSEIEVNEVEEEVNKETEEAIPQTEEVNKETEEVNEETEEVNELSEVNKEEEKEVQEEEPSENLLNMEETEEEESEDGPVIEELNEDEYDSLTYTKYTVKFYVNDSYYTEKSVYSSGATTGAIVLSHSDSQYMVVTKDGQGKETDIKSRISYTKTEVMGAAVHSYKLKNVTANTNVYFYERFNVKVVEGSNSNTYDSYYNHYSNEIVLGYPLDNYVVDPSGSDIIATTTTNGIKAKSTGKDITITLKPYTVTLKLDGETKLSKRASSGENIEFNPVWLLVKDDYICSDQNVSLGLMSVKASNVTADKTINLYTKERIKVDGDTKASGAKGSDITVTLDRDISYYEGISGSYDGYDKTGENTYKFKNVTSDITISSKKYTVKFFVNDSQVSNILNGEQTVAAGKSSNEIALNYSKGQYLIVTKDAQGKETDISSQVSVRDGEIYHFYKLDNVLADTNVYFYESFTVKIVEGNSSSTKHAYYNHDLTGVTLSASTDHYDIEGTCGSITKEEGNTYKIPAVKSDVTLTLKYKVTINVNGSELAVGGSQKVEPGNSAAFVLNHSKGRYLIVTKDSQGKETDASSMVSYEELLGVHTYTISNVNKDIDIYFYEKMDISVIEGESESSTFAYYGHNSEKFYLKMTDTDYDLSGSCTVEYGKETEGTHEGEYYVIFKNVVSDDVKLTYKPVKVTLFINGAKIETKYVSTDASPEFSAILILDADDYMCSDEGVTNVVISDGAVTVKNVKANQDVHINKKENLKIYEKVNEDPVTVYGYFGKTVRVGLVKEIANYVVTGFCDVEYVETDASTGKYKYDITLRSDVTVVAKFDISFDKGNNESVGIHHVVGETVVDMDQNILIGQHRWVYLEYPVEDFDVEVTGRLFSSIPSTVKIEKVIAVNTEWGGLHCYLVSLIDGNIKFTLKDRHKVSINGTDVKIYDDNNINLIMDNIADGNNGSIVRDENADVYDYIWATEDEDFDLDVDVKKSHNEDKTLYFFSISGIEADIALYEKYDVTIVNKYSENKLYTYLKKDKSNDADLYAHNGFAYVTVQKCDVDDPSVVVELEGTALTEGTNYTVEKLSGEDAGKIKITVNKESVTGNLEIRIDAKKQKQTDPTEEKDVKVYEITNSEVKQEVLDEILDPQLADDLKNAINNVEVSNVAEALKDEAISSIISSIAEEKAVEVDTSKDDVRIIVDVKVELTDIKQEEVEQQTVVNSVEFSLTPVAKLYVNEELVGDKAVENNMLKSSGERSILVSIPTCGISPVKELIHRTNEGKFIEKFLRGNVDEGGFELSLDESVAYVKIKHFSTITIQNFITKEKIADDNNIQNIEVVYDYENIYTWSSDYSTCTARRHIRGYEYFVLEETVIARVVKGDDSTQYVAEFENEVFETQYHKVKVEKIEDKVDTKKDVDTSKPVVEEPVEEGHSPTHVWGIVGLVIAVMLTIIYVANKSKALGIVAAAAGIIEAIAMFAVGSCMICYGLAAGGIVSALTAIILLITRKDNK